MVFKCNTFPPLQLVLVPLLPWSIPSDRQRVATVIPSWTLICHKHCNCTILVWVHSNRCVCLLHRTPLVSQVKDRMCNLTAFLHCLFLLNFISSFSRFSAIGPRWKVRGIFNFALLSKFYFYILFFVLVVFFIDVFGQCLPISRWMPRWQCFQSSRCLQSLCSNDTISVLLCIQDVRGSSHCSLQYERHRSSHLPEQRCLCLCWKLWRCMCGYCCWCGIDRRT